MSSSTSLIPPPISSNKEKKRVHFSSCNKTGTTAHGKTSASASTSSLRAAARIQHEKDARRQVELERQAYALQYKLLSTAVVSDETLRKSARYLQRSHYIDVTIERGIAKICGYPCCGNPVDVTKTSNGKYRISLSMRKVFSIGELNSFCSVRCYNASEFYSTQLSSVALYLREDDYDLCSELAAVSLLHNNDKKDLFPTKYDFKKKDDNTLTVKECIVDYDKAVETTLKMPTVSSNTHLKIEGVIVPIGSSTSGTANSDTINGNIKFTNNKISTKKKAKKKVKEIKEKKHTKRKSEHIDNIGHIVGDDSDDSTLSIQPRISFFGELWTTLSQWYTPATRNFFKNEASSVKSSDVEQYASLPKNETDSIEDGQNRTTVDDASFPLLDHVAHVPMRRRLALQHLRSASTDVLNVLGVNELVDSGTFASILYPLVYTLTFTSDSVALSGAHWSVLALVILRRISTSHLSQLGVFFNSHEGVANVEDFMKAYQLDMEQYQLLCEVLNE